MTLRSGLSVYLWAQSPSAGPQVSEISEYLTNLTFSSLAPGGFGTFAAQVGKSVARVLLQQYSVFGRVAVMAGPTCVWLGELITPGYEFSDTGDEYYVLNALGIGNCLRDDPNTWTYSGKTPQFVGQDILAQHVVVTHELNALISTDNSQIFPDNPPATVNVVYDERTMEEILQDQAILAGDYDWGVEADPVQKDAAGFPLGRVYVRKRNLSSLDYTALIAQRDLVSAAFTPTADRAYNHIQIDYTNGTGGLAKYRATDSRLAANLSQGTAPFRYRKFLRDLSGSTLVNAAMAQTIATTYLGLFENVSYQGQASVRALRDSNGNAIPLYQVKAGYNLYIPELAVRAAALPTTPVQNSNLFWITQATYRENPNEGAQVEFQLGYHPDTYDVILARLTMAQDAQSRSGKITNIVQKLGAALQGFYGFSFSNASLGGNVGVGVTWQALASQSPTSVSLSPASTTNVSGLAASSLTAIGCHIGGTATGAGAGSAIGTYLTAGNCLRQVNAETGRFAHHCDGCDTVHTDRSLEEHLRIGRWHGDAPGLVALSVDCPTPGCGRSESYHTGLTAYDEQGGSEPGYTLRAEQARLIRAAMAARGLATA